MNKCDFEMEETVELGSQQVTRIQVFYQHSYGDLCGLIFFTGEKEIARIGETDNHVFASIMITLQEGEKWVGVSSS